jgi:tetratricopeptide (TPR) repeat protein
MAFEVQDINEVEQANRIFTDREEPRKAFWDKYFQYKDNMVNQVRNPITILTYYGIGGIGKSTLLYKIQEELDEYKAKANKKDVIPYVYYDMKTDTSKRAILEGLRKILIKNYGFEFPVFDLALNIYLLKIGKNVTLKELDGIISSNQYVGVATDIASAGVDLLNAVPLAGPVTVGTLKIIDKLIANQRNKSANRKIELSNLQKDSPEDILKNLQLNFAKDLADNLKEAKYPLVVFLDTYEMLVNELASIGEPLMNDAWLRDIHNGLVTYTPNVIWVIAGREIIKWDHINSEWKDNFEQHLVGDLSKVDTMKFLIESGISDLQVQEQIYEITKGTPVYLDICVNNYYYLMNSNMEITKKSLGNDQRELVKRFMVYTDGTQKDILYIISCLDSWTEDYLIKIATENYYPISVTAIKTLEGLSFVETMDGINFRLHQLVKEILYEQCNIDLKRKIMGYDRKYNKEKLNKVDPTSEEYFRLLKNYINCSIHQMDIQFDIKEFYQEVSDNYIKQLINTFQYDEACQIYELILRIAEPDMKDTYVVADIYQKYSECLMSAGKYRDMLYYGEKAVSLLNKSSGEDSIQAIDAQYTLCRLYCTLGRTREAFEIAKTVLKQRKGILGDEHPDTINAMNIMAYIYYALGRLKDGLEISEKVLEQRRRILGEEHLDTIAAMNNISICYSDLGRTKEAIELSEKVLELRNKRLGEEHPDTIMAFNNLALKFNEVGRNKEAVEILEKVLAQRKRIFGDEHPDTIQAMHNLSIIYSNIGRVNEALELSEKVLGLRKEIMGEEHPETIQAMHNLSIIYSDVGRVNEALELSEKVLELRKGILGEEHPNTIKSMNNLSIRYNAIGRTEEALEISEKVLELNKRLLGDEHPDTIMAMNNLSVRLGVLGRTEEALKISEKALDQSKKILGDEHPNTLTIMNNLSNIYSDLGRTKEAIDVLEKALEVMKRILGEEHPDTIKTMKNLSIRYNDAGRTEEAIEISNKELEYYKKTLGEESPSTMKILKMIDYMRKSI